MNLGKSLEDYLEAVLILQNNRGMVRSVDIACHMNFSKPSVCHAVKVLKEKELLTMDKEGFLHLTEKGRESAEKVYEKHCLLTNHLISFGVDPPIAEADACKMEHIISDETFERLKEGIQKA